MNQTLRINNIVNVPQIDNRDVLANLIVNTQKESEKFKNKRQNPLIYKHNIIKALRNSGLEYVNHRNKKILKKVEEWCLNNCCENFPENQQLFNYNKFYNLIEKLPEDNYLASLMRRKESQSNQIRWNYFIKFEDLKEMKVCLQFILSLFQISKSRLLIIQTKLKNNNPLDDLRGRKTVKLPKINPGIFKEFIDLFPKIPSHYTSSQKLYFSNSDLNLNKLFLEYKKFLIEKDLNCNISNSTFFKFFKDNYNFKFKKPRADVCDLCFEFKQRNQTLQLDKLKLYEIHTKNRELHSKLKKGFLQDKNYIVIEFDYAQNRPLPKLPNCDLFYKRFLWLYVFNVHVHDYNSFIFYSLEGDSPKNSNSVCSNLFRVIELLFSQHKLDNKEIVFLSDSTVSHNKNWTMLKFCSFLSIKFKIKITHLFPVKGHSFSICDQKFSQMTSSTKNIEIIENYKKYLAYYESSDDFTVFKSQVYDYSEFLSCYFFENRKEIKVMKAVKFEFFSSGAINSYCDYTSSISNTFNIIKNDQGNLELISNSYIHDNYLIKNIGITKEKSDDIKSILKYISCDYVNFYENYMKKIDKNCQDYFTDSDDE